MKILRFDEDRVGVLKGDAVIDISALISHREVRGPQGTMEELIANLAAYRPRIERLVAQGNGRPLASVRLRAPLARPGRVLAAFVNYLDKPGRTADNLPLEFFHKSPYLVGPEGRIELPDIAAVTVFHAEAELAFVVGKPARRVSQAAAMDHVFGFVPFFDVSARGLIRRSQFLPKGLETFAPCGPWITTVEEIADPHDLTVRSWTNGEPRQSYSTKHMAHPIAEQIAWLSRFIELHPGDVVATGVFHEGLKPINAGDTIEIEIEGLGRARFHVGGDSPRKEGDFQPGSGRRVEMSKV